MRKLTLSLLLGVSAGVLDTVPMIIQGLDWYACTSAFIHWVVLGVIITYIEWDMSPGLKGLIIAEISAIPIIILVLKDDPQSVIPILVFSAILGFLVGYAGNRIIKKQGDKRA